MHTPSKKAPNTSLPDITVVKTEVVAKSRHLKSGWAVDKVEIWSIHARYWILNHFPKSLPDWYLGSVYEVIKEEYSIQMSERIDHPMDLKQDIMSSMAKEISAQIDKEILESFSVGSMIKK